MPHRFVTTAIVSFLAVLTQSILLVPTGLMVLGFATVTLFQNEAGWHIADAARATVEAPPNNAGGLDATAISVTAPLQPSEQVSDPVFFDDGGAMVTRTVEMWAWYETTTVNTHRRWGGSRELETVTTYEQGWVAGPTPTEGFKHPEGHENPRPAHDSTVFVPQQFSLGAWTVDPMWTMFFAGVPVAPEDSVGWTDAGSALHYDVESGWYYVTESGQTAPTLGDLRVRFSRLPSGSQVTVFGVAEGEHVMPAEWLEGVSVIPLLPGNRAAAIELTEALDAMLLWVIRILGTIAMFVGLVMVTGPIVAVFDIIPPVGTLVRVVGAFLLLPIALGWSAVVMGASQVVRSPVVLFIVALLLFGVARAWWDGRKERKAWAAQTAANGPKVTG